MPDNNVDCYDFLKFQDTLKKMREIDDKIIYALNTSIPTESFRSKIDPTTKCKELYAELTTARSDRQNMIKKCIHYTADQVKQFKEQKELHEDDLNYNKKLKAEQTKLRALQMELSVEDVVKERSSKVFHERCRLYYNENEINS